MPLDEEQRKFFSFWEGTKRGVLALERKHFNDPERQDLHDYIAHEKVSRPPPPTRLVVSHRCCFIVWFPSRRIFDGR